MVVQDVMTKDVATVAPDTSLKDVARVLVDLGVSGLPVVEDDAVRRRRLGGGHPREGARRPAGAPTGSWGSCSPRGSRSARSCGP